MKLYLKIFFSLALMALFNVNSAFAQEQSQLFPTVNSGDTYKIADVFWLPDYLKDNLDRNTGGSIPGGEDDIVSKKCSTYGFQDTYDATHYICDTVKPKPGMSCYKNCRCKPTTIPGVGEDCALTCGGNCIKPQCKPAVALTLPNDKCTQKCTQDQSICTAKTCDSKCASGTSLTCTGPVTGNDGCGKDCKKCCDQNCPTGTSETDPKGCGGSVQNECKTKTCYNPYKACCTEACPVGTTENNPGGCGGSVQNGCKTKTCYYGYKACCSNSGYSSCPSNQFAVGFTNGCGNYHYWCYSGMCDDVIYQAEGCRYVASGQYSYYTSEGAKARAECRRPDGSRYTIADVGYVYSNVSGTVVSYDLSECQKIMKERGVKVGEIKSPGSYR